MRASRAGLLVALFASSLALRPQIVGIGPLLPRIQDDLDVSHAVAGLLGTIPVLCMGLFAPVAPYLAGRAGPRRAIAVSVALIGAAGIGRALVPGVAGVLLLTVPVGIGIALAGALMPVAVKGRFADRPAFATGIYASGINTGSGASAAAAVPLAAALGGWRGALLAISGASLACVAVWLARTPPDERGEGRPPRPPRLPLRSGTVWTLVALFGLLGIGFYGLNQWLSDSYVERGWSEASAGVLLAVMNVVMIPGGFGLGWLADRVRSRRVLFVACGAVQVVSLLGILLAPGAGWAWVTLFGLTNGGLFTLVMTLPLDVARGPAEVGAVAGMMLGVGYTVSALSPFALGAVRDATGTFTGSLWVVLGTAAVLTLIASTLTPGRLRRGVGTPQPLARTASR